MDGSLESVLEGVGEEVHHTGSDVQVVAKLLEPAVERGATINLDPGELIGQHHAPELDRSDPQLGVEPGNESLDLGGEVVVLQSSTVLRNLQGHQLNSRAMSEDRLDLDDENVNVLLHHVQQEHLVLLCWHFFTSTVVIRVSLSLSYSSLLMCRPAITSCLSPSARSINRRAGLLMPGNSCRQSPQ